MKDLQHPVTTIVINEQHCAVTTIVMNKLKYAVTTIVMNKLKNPVKTIVMNELQHAVTTVVMNGQRNVGTYPVTEKKLKFPVFKSLYGLAMRLSLLIQESSVEPRPSKTNQVFLSPALYSSTFTCEAQIINLYLRNLRQYIMCH